MLLLESPSEIIKEVLKKIFDFFFKVKLTGNEFLLQTKNGILLCNHLDYMDFFFPLFYIEKKIFLLYSLEFKDPSIFNIVFNEISKKFLQFINIKTISEEEVDQTIKEIAQKNLLFIFPELKPSETGILTPFSYKIINSVYTTSLERKIPILPCGINGTQQISLILQNKNFDYGKIKIEINIGNPIFFDNNINLEQFSEEMQKQIYALSQHPERRKRGRFLIKTEAREF